MKLCHENNGAAIYVEGPPQCTILCLNVHTTVEYLNTNVSIGQLLQHIVVCALSRPKMLTKMLTKTYNKDIYHLSFLF